MHVERTQPEPDESCADYARIERVIRRLDEGFLEQPSLEELAEAAGLSASHFQRLFSRWAGISPKRFLQFLTVEHAKRRLAESRPVLEAALECGLSGPGRLHDLFVKAEAVSPGEFKSRGGGIEIGWGFHETPFGLCLLGVTERGVCWLGFLNGEEREGALAELKGHWRGAALRERTEWTGPVARAVFARLGRRAPLSVLLLGTNFQLKVWQALLRIPEGGLATYESISAAIGSPGACRATGTAVGQNAISYLIPCHRVIRKSGMLGGYRWGPARKRAILAWEAARQGAPAKPAL
jgi:AraC family transcriptional regulator of adaptative response/methylated-DNA-[protein]-cysteine methyltransferase